MQVFWQKIFRNNLKTKKEAKTDNKQVCPETVLDIQPGHIKRVHPAYILPVRHEQVQTANFRETQTCSF